MRTLSILFAAAIAFIGCNDKNTEGLSIQTDKAAYTIGEQVRITVTTSADFSAYVPSCCDSLAYYIDKSENGSWREFNSYGVLCVAVCSQTPIKITRESSRGMNFVPTEQGTYRFRIPFGRSTLNQMEEESVSPTFVIK